MVRYLDPQNVFVIPAEVPGSARIHIILPILFQEPNNPDLNLLSVAGCDVGYGPAGLLLDALLGGGQQAEQAR